MNKWIVFFVVSTITMFAGLVLSLTTDLWAYGRYPCSLGFGFLQRTLSVFFALMTWWGISCFKDWKNYWKDD